MAEIASINFKKSTAWQIYHNDKHRPGYAIGGEVLCRPDAAEALRIKQDIVNRAIETYTKRTGQKFQAKSYEWSAVVNLKDKPTQELYEDLKKLRLHFQEKYGYQCYQVAIHKDEGHIDENGEKCLNLHAHLEFITLDKETGKNNFRGANTTKKALSQIQDEVAEILGMERGIKTLNLRADERRALKRIEPRVWAKMKESEKGERKKLLENVKSKHEHELGEVKFKANQDILKYKESKDDEIIGLQTALQNEKKAHKDEKEAHELTKKELDTLKIKFNKEEMKGKGFVKADFDNLGNCVREMAKQMELGEKFTIEQVTQKFNEILLKAQENKELRERAEKERDEKAQELERDRAEINKLRNILADLRDKEPAKTAENQKNNENLYTAEQIKDLFDFEYELNQQANTIDKDIKEFDKKENVLLPDAKQRKIKEIGVNTSNLLDKIAKNTHLENLFSFENCKEKVQKAIKWLKDKGLSLTKTQNTGLSI